MSPQSFDEVGVHTNANITFVLVYNSQLTFSVLIEATILANERQSKRAGERQPRPQSEVKLDSSSLQEDRSQITINCYQAWNYDVSSLRHEDSDMSLNVGNAASFLTLDESND